MDNTDKFSPRASTMDVHAPTVMSIHQLNIQIHKRPNAERGLQFSMAPQNAPEISSSLSQRRASPHSITIDSVGGSVDEHHGCSSTKEFPTPGTETDTINHRVSAAFVSLMAPPLLTASSPFSNTAHVNDKKQFTTAGAPLKGLWGTREFDLGHGTDELSQEDSCFKADSMASLPMSSTNPTATFTDVYPSCLTSGGPNSVHVATIAEGETAAYRSQVAALSFTKTANDRFVGTVAHSLRVIATDDLNPAATGSTAPSTEVPQHQTRRPEQEPPTLDSSLTAITLSDGDARGGALPNRIITHSIVTTSDCGSSIKASPKREVIAVAARPSLLPLIEFAPKRESQTEVVIARAPSVSTWSRKSSVATATAAGVANNYDSQSDEGKGCGCCQSLGSFFSSVFTPKRPTVSNSAGVPTAQVAAPRPAATGSAPRMPQSKQIQGLGTQPGPRPAATNQPMAVNRNPLDALQSPKPINQSNNPFINKNTSNSAAVAGPAGMKAARGPFVPRPVYSNPAPEYMPTGVFLGGSSEMSTDTDRTRELPPACLAYNVGRQQGFSIGASRAPKVHGMPRPCQQAPIIKSAIDPTDPHYIAQFMNAAAKGQYIKMKGIFQLVKMHIDVRDEKGNSALHYLLDKSLRAAALVSVAADEVTSRAYRSKRHKSTSRATRTKRHKSRQRNCANVGNSSFEAAMAAAAAIVAGTQVALTPATDEKRLLSRSPVLSGSEPRPPDEHHPMTDAQMDGFFFNNGASLNYFQSNTAQSISPIEAEPRQLQKAFPGVKPDASGSQPSSIPIRMPCHHFAPYCDTRLTTCTTNDSYDTSSSKNSSGSMDLSVTRPDICTARLDIIDPYLMTLELLLAMGANPNATNLLGRTPLHYAASIPAVINFDVEAVRTVLEKTNARPSPHRKVTKGPYRPPRPVLVKAGRIVDSEATAILRTPSSSASMANSSDSLVSAASRSKLRRNREQKSKCEKAYRRKTRVRKSHTIESDVLKELFKKPAAGSQLPLCDNLAEARLLASSFHAKAIKILIEKKANVNANDLLNNTPLHNAAQSFSDGNPFLGADIIRELIANGASLDIRNKQGLTPLESAIQRRTSISNSQQVHRRLQLRFADLDKEWELAEVAKIRDARANPKPEDYMTTFDLSLYSRKLEDERGFLAKGGPKSKHYVSSSSYLASQRTFAAATKQLLHHYEEVRRRQYEDLELLVLAGSPIPRSLMSKGSLGFTTEASLHPTLTATAEADRGVTQQLIAALSIYPYHPFEALESHQMSLLTRGMEAQAPLDESVYDGDHEEEEETRSECKDEEAPPAENLGTQQLPQQQSY